MRDPTQWEYTIHSIRNQEIPRLGRILAYFGRGGWELVTMSTTVKYWFETGNELVMVFKRPTTEPADLSIRWAKVYDDQGTPIADPWGDIGEGAVQRNAAVDERYHGA
jgi:hypothetical protein